MKMLMNIIVLCMLVLLSASSQCVNEEDSGPVGFFEFENQSEENIYITKMVLLMTDSIITNSYFLCGYLEFNEISKHKSYKFGYGNVISDKYFQFNVYKHSTMNKYSRQELIDNEIYDKRYILSLSDLQAMDFKIIYTGND